MGGETTATNEKAAAAAGLVARSDWSPAAGGFQGVAMAPGAAPPGDGNPRGGGDVTAQTRPQGLEAANGRLARCCGKVTNEVLWPRCPRDVFWETMATEVEAHKLLVRRCVDDLKKLDGASRYQVATFIPPMQKLVDLEVKLRRLPKSLCEDVKDVMAQQGAAELLAQALTSLSDKDSPVPDANFRPINATVTVLLRYTDSSPAMGRAVGQCGTIKHLLDILKHQPLWERSKTEPAMRSMMICTIGILANIAPVQQNRACFRQSNALPVMQMLLQNDLSEVRLQALQVIFCILEEADCDPLGNSEPVDLMMLTLNKPNIYGRYKSMGEIFFLAEQLLETLALMSACGPVRRKIYEAGAVAPLVQSLRQGRSAEKLHAVTTLSRLSRDPGTCSQMRQGRAPRRQGLHLVLLLLQIHGGVPKWQEGDVQAWLEESSLGAYCPNFTQIDGRILHSLLEIRQQAPEFFAMVAREVGGFHRLEDFLKFLDAVEKLD
ncbi:unnamed protein product [Lampetra planeri]